MIEKIPSREEVEKVAKELAPDVVRIRMDEGNDWSGDPALYFRVLVRDEVSRPGERLHKLADRVRERLKGELHLPELKHIAYFDFLNESERATRTDHLWD